MTGLIALVCIFAMNVLLLHAETVHIKLVESSNDFVPIVNIRGTKLYTGIYYKVGMKAFPQGWLTWTDRANYIEVELDPKALPKYVDGQPFQYDNQWSFGISESDLGYAFMNRGKPLGSLIWVNAETVSGNHVSVYDDPESIKKMAAGGEWRNDALWIPISTNEDNFYKLENLAKRGSFLTWTYKKHNDYNYYIQLGNYDAKDDAKFSFKPKAIRVEAKVFDLKLEESIDDILKRTKDVTESLLAKKQIPNTSDTEITTSVEESTKQTVRMTFNFNESFKMMQKTTIDAVDQVHSFDGGFAANQDRSIDITKSLEFKANITVAPYTLLEASLTTTTAKMIVVPFTAKMLVAGFADRLLRDRPGETRDGRVPADLVEDFMKSSGSSNMEIVSRTGDDLIVRVSGVIKVSPAVKISMAKKQIQFLTIPSPTRSPIVWD